MKLLTLFLFLLLPLQAVTLIPLFESQLIDRLEEDSAWQVAIRPGSTLPGVHEVALASPETTPQSADFNDHQIKIPDILDVFEPQTTVTPFFITYTDEQELVFGMGPTQGFTTTVQLSIPNATNVSTITILGEIRNVATSTHVRLSSLFLNTTPFPGIDINGDPVFPGSNPFQGFDLTDFDTTEPWTIFGELTVDYAGEPPVPGNDEYTIFFLGSAIPEPSVISLLLGLLVFCAQRRR